VFVCGWYQSIYFGKVEVFSGDYFDNQSVFHAFYSCHLRALYCKIAEGEEGAGWKKIGGKKEKSKY